MGTRSWSLCAVILGLGCGGSPSSPKDKCERLVDTVCDRVSTCLDEEDQQDACVTAGRDALTCAEITSVSISYDDCIDDIEAASCDALVENDDTGEPSITLPLPCRGALRKDGGAATPTLGPAARWRVR